MLTIGRDEKEGIENAKGKRKVDEKSVRAKRTLRILKGNEIEGDYVKRNTFN